MKALLLLLFLASCTPLAHKKPIKLMRGLREANVSNVVSPRKLKVKVFKRPMEDVEENTHEQKFLFQNVMNEIKEEKERIQEFQALHADFMPSVEQLIGGVVNQIGELGASVDSMLKRANI